MKKLFVLVAVVVGFGCGSVRGEVVLEHVRDIDESGDTVVLDDGRVFWLDAPGGPSAIVSPPAVAVDARLAVGARGEMLVEDGLVGETPRFVPSAVAPAPVDLLGGQHFRQSDGRVFDYFVERLTYRDELTGAKACVFDGCLVGGAFVMVGGKRTFAGPFDQVVSAFVPSKAEDTFVPGWRLLRRDGKVVTVSNEYEPVMREIDGLPAIARMYGSLEPKAGFLRATNGEMWFVGNVDGIPEDVLDQGDSFVCKELHLRQYERTCVRPTRVPALDNTHPANLSALYAVSDSGQLLCFAKTSPCPKRAAQ